ncbi:hypothetical protein BJ165DRAFT_259215 [Panaeolus papilionaceus]|nr:hypothetical protein BJ165DRAFT_259215 [Panaeolus papilionaceus]
MGRLTKSISITVSIGRAAFTRSRSADPPPSDQDPQSAYPPPLLLTSYKGRKPSPSSIQQSNPITFLPPLLIETLLVMGVTVETISPGDGRTFPKKGDTVTIHYHGTLLDGKTFDSSRDRGVPFQTQIGIGKVIRGWDEGVTRLSLGEKAILTTTPDFGYGSRGFPPVIPPNSVLRFELELLKIN